MLNPGSKVYFKTSGDTSRVIPVRLANDAKSRVMQVIESPQSDDTRVVPVQLTTDMRAIPIQLRGPTQTSMEGWWRFGQGITVATGVSQWNDQTANARHLTQGTGGNQPALQSDNSILFDGVDDYLTSTSFALAQPVTWYLLFKNVTHTNSDPIVTGLGGGTHVIIQGGVSARITITAGGNNIVNDNLALNTYGAFAGVFNSTAFVSQVNTTTAVTGDGGTNGFATGFRLGADGTPALFGNIQVKELILYSAAHDANTRAKIINYLIAVSNGQN